MPQSYRRIQEQLLKFMREQFVLTEGEAAILLDDIVLNLEAMVADLAPREDMHTDQAKSPERILRGLSTLAEQLPCTMLSDIAENLSRVHTADGQPLPDHAIEPLQHFVRGLRRAMSGLRPESSAANGSPST